MAKLISGQRLPWKRFWAPWNGRIRCGSDGRGFLENPEGFWGKISNSQVRSIDELLKSRCVVLSGHPGIGKTVEIERAEENLKKKCQTPEQLFFYHCRAIASTEMLRAATVSHNCWLQARAANREITLIIDGIDEGLRKVPEFVDALAVFLRSEPPDQLRVVLVCRSAEWDVAAGERLMRLWNEKECSGVYELCPLRYQDAEEAACASGLNDRAFMKAVFRHQVQGLAARPITLRMLLDEFGATRRFPDTRKELYARAARRMCDEIDEDRLKSLRKHLHPYPEDQVYRTVSRIAALLMLSAKTVVLKRDDEKPTAVELPWHSIIGGTEISNGEPFEVTNPLVEAALETGHFSFRGPYRYGFDHPTFAESLAADYLRKLPLVQLRQLLCQRFNGGDWVVPQLAEVAAWLALDHCEWRRFLIETQPTILLRTDISKFSNADKKLAVSSLLRRADNEEAFEEQSISRFYHALRHPGIASQLRPYIADRSRNIVVRRIAIEIAGDAGVQRLEPLLWKLAAENDPAFNAVAGAIRDLAGLNSKKELVAAMEGKFLGDTRKDLTGIALQILVPKMMSVRSVLRYLEDGLEKGYAGAYESALGRNLPKALVIADIPMLLKRMGEWTTCFDTLSSLHNLAQRGFALALENLHRRPIREAATEMWLIKLKSHAPLPSLSPGNEKTAETGLFQTQLRRDFVRALLESSLATAEDILSFHCCLVDHLDLGWLLGELQQAPEKQLEKWAQLVGRCVWGPDREKYKRLLLQTYDSVPVLARFLPARRKGNIIVTLDRHQRAQELLKERNQRRWRRHSKVPRRRELLNHALEVIRKGNSNGWVGFSEYAFVSGAPEVKPDWKVSRLDIATSPGWRDINPSEKEEITEAARRFLLEYEDKRENPRQCTNYSDAGYLAIRLLRQHIKTDRNLRRAIKDKWIYCVTDRLNNAEEEHQEQIALAYRLSPERVTNRLLLAIQADDASAGLSFGFNVFGRAWCKKISAALTDFVANASLKPRTMSAILQYVAHRDRRRAIATSKALLNRQEEAIAFSARIRAVAAVALFTLPQELWNIVWPLIVKLHAEAAQQLFLENAWDFSHGESNFYDNLTDRQLGELYLFLLTLFPVEADPREITGQVFNVTTRHQMQRVRDECTNVLARRGTATALEELNDLATKVPAAMQIWLRWTYAEGLKNYLRHLWTAGAPTPQEILALTQSRAAWRVEDDETLREAVLLSLSRLQTELSSDGLPSARELWNEPNLKRHLHPQPKNEELLSHLIRRWLDKDLAGKSGIVVNCEVKLKRFGRGKVDIKVQAFARGQSIQRRMTLIIEVKRCSHPDIANACQTQLAECYLAGQGLTHGIYLVGWFGSKRGAVAKWKSFEDARQTVEKWANTSTSSSATITGFVLDCRLPDMAGPTSRKKVGRKS
jgi:hypothetical protein